MATSVRRFGLFSRSGRKISREDEGNTKIMTRKISRDEMSSSMVDSAAGLQQLEVINRKISLTTTASTVAQSTCTTSISRQRKISVYSRPELLDSNIVTQSKNVVTTQTEGQPFWRDFLNHYGESFILGALFLLIITVSLYIVFIEGQSLIGKEK